MSELLRFAGRKFLGGLAFLFILVVLASLAIIIGAAAYGHPLGLALFASGAIAGAAALHLLPRHASKLRRLLQFLPHHA